MTYQLFSYVLLRSTSTYDTNLCTDCGMWKKPFMTKETQIIRSKIDTGTISVVVRNHYCRSILGANTDSYLCVKMHYVLFKQSWLLL